MALSLLPNCTINIFVYLLLIRFNQWLNQLNQLNHDLEVLPIRPPVWFLIHKRLPYFLWIQIMCNLKEWRVLSIFGSGGKIKWVWDVQRFERRRKPWSPPEAEENPSGIFHVVGSQSTPLHRIRCRPWIRSLDGFVSLFPFIYVNPWLHFTWFLVLNFWNLLLT